MVYIPAFLVKVSHLTRFYGSQYVISLSSFSKERVVSQPFLVLQTSGAFRNAKVQT